MSTAQQTSVRAIHRFGQTFWQVHYDGGIVTEDFKTESEAMIAAGLSPRLFQYSSYRDRAGLPAWFDCQTRRHISQRTAIRRTGLPRAHFVSFENGADGHGYRMSLVDRQAAEEAAGVCLFS